MYAGELRRDSLEVVASVFRDSKPVTIDRSKDFLGVGEDDRLGGLSLAVVHRQQQLLRTTVVSCLRLGVGTFRLLVSLSPSVVLSACACH